jgi:KDO2-lipid IV(A) lauroyltransferase
MMAYIFGVMAFLSHIVPRRFAIWSAKKLADIMYFTFYKKRVKIVINNLKKVHKSLTYRDAKIMAGKIYRNFAQFIYEFLILPKINKSNLFQYLEIKDKEYLDNAIKKGKGAIVLTSHLGNWELGAAMLGILGYAPTVISLPQPSKYIKNFFTKRREAVGMKVVYLEDKLRDVFYALKRGKVVATLGDRVYSGPQKEGRLFGEKLYFPKGIFEIQKRIGAPILPAFCIKEGEKYKVYFEPELKNGIEEWSEILERYIKQYTTQWFVFDPLWN